MTLLGIRLPPWQRRAACKDQGNEAFFVHQGADQGPAMAICRRCPVRQDCLDYALDNHIDHGIWGGMSARARRRMRYPYLTA